MTKTKSNSNLSIQVLILLTYALAFLSLTASEVLGFHSALPVRATTRLSTNHRLPFLLQALPDDNSSSESAEPAQGEPTLKKRKKNPQEE